MISSLLQSQASRVTPRALNNARATFSRQVGRCQSTLPESSHDEIQKLAKTLNGMLKPFVRVANKPGIQAPKLMDDLLQSPNSQAAQCEHPYWRYRNAWTQHPWAYRRRGGGLLKALLLVGIGYGGCKWISEKRDHHREMDMALAKAKATGDFTEWVAQFYNCLPDPG